MTPSFNMSNSQKNLMLEGFDLHVHQLALVTQSALNSDGHVTVCCGI